MSLCVRGDAGAFAQLVEKYHRPLYRMAYRMTGNTEDALDLTQSAFLKAYQKLGSYRPESKFFSWIYRIAVNEGINHLARSRVQESLRRRVEEDGAGPSDGAGPVPGTYGWVQPALLELSLEYRVAIILRHFLDLSYGQMAEILGIPEKTVKSRLFSARRRLRDFVVEHEPEVADRRR